MAEGFDSAALLNYMPPEILRNIFFYLPAKALIHCREVNTMWRAIVDSMYREEFMWQENCLTDFPTMYEEARKKAKPGLLYFNLYRSLSLWKMFVEAEEEREEFCAHSDGNEIRNFRILDNGIIGVLQKHSIAYYDIETLERSKRPRITGEFSTYTETNNLVIVLTFNSNLYVIRKTLQHSWHETAATFKNVTQFYFAGSELYYVTLCDKIFVVYLRYNKFKTNYLARSPRPIMTIGHSEGNLNILTVQREILSIDIDNNCFFLLRDTLGTGTTLLRQLDKYKFLEMMDWRLFFQWVHIWTPSAPVLPLSDVVFVKVYGDISFIGCNSGILSIYHIPTANQEYNIFESTPIKQYNFSQDGGNTSPGSCPILNIEIMESIDGHTVIVALPKKIIVLNYSHDFETETSSICTSPEIPELPELDPGEGPSGTAGDGVSINAAGLCRE